MLELKDIAYKIDNKNILNDVSLKLDKKKIYAITGPNGGGKSSLVKIIMGIYKQDSGNVILDGEDISNYSICERALKGIGFGFQHSPRFKGITVEDLLNISMKNNKDKRNLNSLLIDVGLSPKEYLKREIDSTLSGGELKRIEIATVLAGESKLVVFDEPEAGIDLWSFRRLIRTFEKMHKSNDCTIVIISHQEKILQLADEIILMEDGKIKEITKGKEMLNKIQFDCDNLCCMKGYGCNAAW